jgi:hypothetical protein
MIKHACILGKASVFGSAPCSKNIDDGQSNDSWGKKKTKTKTNSATLTNS